MMWEPVGIDENRPIALGYWEFLCYEMIFRVILLDARFITTKLHCFLHNDT